MRRRALAVLGLAAAFFAGFAVGRFPGDRAPSGPAPARQMREGAGVYTNPLLECEMAQERLYVPLRPFGRQLDELTNSLERDGRVARVSTYLRELNNGAWVGHDEKRNFVPASLAKVPVVIACFRLAGSDPGFLTRKIVYDGLPAAREPGFDNPEVNLQRGQAYTVDELILRIAKYSDNAAAALLVKALPPRLLGSVYFDLGIDPHRLESGDLAISPKEYGAFFRVLYNASYLSRRFSEQALSYFNESTFELGLVAGVPAGVPVSHKFGVWERGGGTASPSLQLHDCGIVYHPQRPYLLCVMTSGVNYVEMAAAIAAVSRLAYQQVDRAVIRPGDWDALSADPSGAGVP